MPTMSGDNDQETRESMKFVSATKQPTSRSFGETASARVLKALARGYPIG